MSAQSGPVKAQTELEFLASLGEAIGRSVALEDAITAALRLAARAVEAEGSSLLLGRRDGSLAFYAVSRGAELEKMVLARGEGILGFVAETGVPVVVSDVCQEPRFSPRLDAVRGLKTRSLACVPIRAGGVLRGALEVVGSRVGDFDDRGQDLLGAIADFGGLMIHSAELGDEMKELHSRLRELSRVRAEFLATMTHELRTPLTIVISNLDLLLGGYLGELNPRQKESLKAALRNASEALNLISGLLDLSRIEAGHVAIRAEEFRLEDIWPELELLCRVGLSGKEVELYWNVEDPLPTLHTDRLKLKEILSNIVFNAVKFTDRGKIEVHARPLGEELEIEVKDTGAGIPGDFLPYLFEPFRQAENAPSGSQGGVGLGLAISKRLLNLIHGRIEVESEAGKGSTFRITIPVRYAA